MPACVVMTKLRHDWVTGAGQQQTLLLNPSSVKVALTLQALYINELVIPLRRRFNEQSCVLWVLLLLHFVNHAFIRMKWVFSFLLI